MTSAVPPATNRRGDDDYHAVAVDEHGYPVPVTGGWRLEAQPSGLNLCCGSGCCLAWCCPCISFGQISARLGIYSYGAAVLIYLIVAAVPAMVGRYFLYKDCYGYSRFLMCHRRAYTGTSSELDACLLASSNSSLRPVGIILSSVAYAFAFFLVWWLRRRVRSILRIPGFCIEDALCAFFCQCCALFQLGLHVGSMPHEAKGACKCCGAPPTYTATVSVKDVRNGFATPIAGLTPEPDRNGLLYVKL